MKALSIKQPWAWLICAGYKDIENRNWKIGRNARYGAYSSYDVANFSINLPERIYIHAGKKPDDIGSETWSSIYNNVPLPAWQYVWSKSQWLGKVFGLTLGAIIGEVDIIGCVEQSDSPWFIGKYGFTLANPVLYGKPIPYRGALGFFEVESDIEL